MAKRGKSTERAKGSAADPWDPSRILASLVSVRLSAFRDVGQAGEPYPEWIRDLKGRSGVYVLKEGNAIRYVGESHTDRLYETLTRHLQRWQLPSSKSYRRGTMRAAVLVLSDRDEAPSVQAHYICELAPSDNVYEQCEAVPF